MKKIIGGKNHDESRQHFQMAHIRTHHISSIKTQARAQANICLRQQKTKFSMLAHLAPSYCQIPPNCSSVTRVTVLSLKTKLVRWGGNILRSPQAVWQVPCDGEQLWPQGTWRKKNNDISEKRWGKQKQVMVSKCLVLLKRRNYVKRKWQRETNIYNFWKSDLLFGEIVSDRGNKDFATINKCNVLFEKQNYNVSIIHTTKHKNHISHLIFGKSFDMNMFDSLNYSIIKFHSVST